MRLLSIASASVIGGATFSLLSLLKGLKDKGVDIEVVVPTNGFLCEELSKIGISYHICKVPFAVLPSHKSIRDFILYFPRLARSILLNELGYKKLKMLVSNIKPDIIHTNVSAINVGFRVARKFEIPHVWHVREYGDKDFDFHHFPSDKLFRKNLRDKSNAICITKDIFNYFQLGHHAKIIYNGIESSALQPQASRKENLFIFAGHLSDGKGTRTIIREFSKFASIDKQGYILELWGASPENYTKLLKNEILELGMEDKIFLTGETKEIYSVMQKAKAIIVPSRYEGFGRITAEAMINNCLVIGRNTAGTKEQFDNGYTLIGHEIAVRFEHDAEIPSCLKAVAQMSDEEYSAMTSNARKTVLQLYNSKNNITETFNFFKELLTK